MTHRGPFQPLPFCDSVVNPALNVGTRVTRLYRSVFLRWKKRNFYIDSFLWWEAVFFAVGRQNDDEKNKLILAVDFRNVYQHYSLAQFSLK